jgi:hypothetical protein
MKRANGYWTKNIHKAILEAQKYIHLNDFRKNSPCEYHALKRRKLLKDYCSHMVPKAHTYRRYVYTIEFIEKKLVYVGLSFNPEHRFYNHIVASHNSDLKHCLSVYRSNFNVICGPLEPTEAQLAEKRVVEEYKNSGWTMLNIATAGCLGSKRRRFTPEYCREFIKTLYGIELKRLRLDYSELYKVVTKFPDWKEIKKNFDSVRLDYSMDFLIEQFSKFPSGHAMKSDRLACNAYFYAVRHNLVKELSQHFCENPGSKYYTSNTRENKKIELIKKQLMLYEGKSLQTLIKQDRALYARARRRDLIYKLRHIFLLTPTSPKQKGDEPKPAPQINLSS